MGAFTLNDIISDTKKKTTKKTKNKNEIQMISIFHIQPNPKNTWEMITEEEKDLRKQELEELKFSILTMGLQQNLVVMKRGKDDFMLLTGERRWTALNELYKEGYTQFEYVPCLVRSPEDIDLPISDEMKEEYLINDTNSKVRTKTNRQMMAQMQWEERLYHELRDAGYDFPKGMKKRAYLSEKMGISQSQVQRYDVIRKNGSEKTKTAFEEEHLDLTAAVALSKLEPQQQDELIEKAGTRITEEEVKRFKEEKRKEQLSEQELRDIFSQVFSVFCENTSCLTVKGYVQKLKEEYGFVHAGGSVKIGFYDSDPTHFHIKNDQFDEIIKYTWSEVAKKMLEFHMIELIEPEKKKMSKAGTKEDSVISVTDDRKADVTSFFEKKEVLDYGQVEICDDVVSMMQDLSKRIEDSRIEYKLQEKESIIRDLENIKKAVKRLESIIM